MSKRKDNAYLILACIAAIALAVLAVHSIATANPADVPESHDDSAVNAQSEAEEVDLGQHRKFDKLTKDERWIRDNYPETAETKGQVVVFSAAWCGPCRRYKPVVNALEVRYNVLKYDYDTERGKALYDRLKDEDHSGVPLTVILVEGKIKKKFSGPQRLATIEQDAADCRKEKKDDDETRRIDIGPLNIDIDPDGDVDINWRRRDRP